MPVGSVSVESTGIEILVGTVVTWRADFVKKYSEIRVRPEYGECLGVQNSQYSENCEHQEHRRRTAQSTVSNFRVQTLSTLKNI